MTLPVFLKLVEIRTKLASVLPFLIGVLFVVYRYDVFHPLNTMIFFCSMLLFDMTCTAINNYMDYTKATSDQYRKEENIIGQKNLSKRAVVATIFTMLIIAAILGIWLVALTDFLVLFIGIFCFAVGVFYTFGPIPLSRMPVGEVFSGITMGFGIVFLSVYVNAFDQGIASFLVQKNLLVLNINFQLMLEIIWISLPCVFTIANVMLANNVCDLEEDIANERYTLPYYIGKKYSITLFNILYVLTFISIVVAVFFNIVPTVMLLSLIVIFPVYRHIQQFNRKQVKSETFQYSVVNLMLVNGTLVLMLALSTIV